MKLLPLIASALFGVSFSQCNVNDPKVANSLEVLLDDDLANLGAQLKVLPNAALSGNGAKIVSKDLPGAISGVWFTEKQRFADGFAATFSYNIGGNTDGVAFVVQNDKIVNTLGGGGNNLGFSEGVSNYFALGIDTCLDRATGNCNQQQVRIETRKDNEAPATITVDLGGFDATGEHKVTVVYSDFDKAVSVFFDDESTPRLTGNIPDKLEVVFGDKFAFFGFTASNSFFEGSQLVAADVVVENIKIVQMISQLRLDAASSVQKSVDFGTLVRYRLVFVDTCNDKLDVENPSDTAIADIISKLDITFTADGLDREPDRPDSVAAEVLGSGEKDEAAYIILFTTPAGVEATWTLEIKFGEVVAQQNPINNILDTTIPEAGGLKPLGIGLLAALIVVLLIGVILIARGVRRYYNKLKEHAEDIEYGIVKEKIDTIDKEIEYEMNPMVAPLDKLKERLAHNEKVIEQLKAGQRDAEDGDFTVEQLQRENAELRTEMNDLKKKQEFMGAGNRISARFTRFFGGGKKGKLDFDQEKA